ncbi:outer membrane beta-barrel protein [Gelidibacter salicanalis]|uniref:PorT family protein n=1 Tax=Gelidibacter salicanalis TaxID=291193 RepID=A0A934KSC6_9FLAO|nr:outer membrane beta-barrel protein [Gelidibacter salicanalis]MBJ7882934.1 PorT family protein [Gelidibacter salicanalis]
MMTFKNSVLAALVMVSTLLVNAQEPSTSYGVKGGLNLTFFTIDQQNLGSYSTSETGFYGGVFVTFPIDDFLIIQPEVLYISVGDFNFLNVPLYANYEVAKKLHLLAGPSVNYFFDFFTGKLKVGADISSSYEISKILEAHVKFTLGLDELAPNGLFFGLGLKL